MLRTTIILLFSCLTVSLSAQKTLSPKQQKKDFKQLLALLEAHPAPYLWTTEEAFNQKSKEIEKQLTEERNLIEFYKLIAPLVAMMKDGHSKVFFPYDHLESIQKKNGVFPYEVYLSDEDEFYLMASLEDNQAIPKGAKA